MFSSFLSAIIGLGVQNGQDPRVRRRIEVINIFNIVCAFAGICYASAFLFEHDHSYSVLILFFATGSFSAISYLQHLGRYSFAGSLLHTNCGVAALLMSFLHGWQSGFSLCYLATPLMIAAFQDLRNVKRTLFLVVYYSTMLLVAYLFHYFGVEANHDHTESLFLINLLFVLGLNSVLAFYLWRIYDDYSQQLDIQNLGLSRANETLLQTNLQVETLVSQLHDKVKNNLQTFVLFAEIDKLSHTPMQTADYVKLTLSRFKVVDICYSIEFEHKLPKQTWFKHFGFYYIRYLYSHFPLQLPKNTPVNFQIKHTDTLVFSRKRFDATMLLINELLFHVINPLTAPLTGKITIYTYQIAGNKYCLGVNITNYPFLPAFSPFFIRFATLQKLNLFINYNEKSKHLLLEILFET